MEGRNCRTSNVVALSETKVFLVGARVQVSACFKIRIYVFATRDKRVELCDASLEVRRSMFIVYRMYVPRPLVGRGHLYEFNTSAMVSFRVAGVTNTHGNFRLMVRMVMSTIFQASL